MAFPNSPLFVNDNQQPKTAHPEKFNRIDDSDLTLLPRHIPIDVITTVAFRVELVNVANERKAWPTVGERPFQVIFEISRLLLERESRRPVGEHQSFLIK